jgi:hypothetical protein
VGGHDDHRGSRPVGADQVDQFETGEPGHLDIGDDHVGLECGDRRPGQQRVGDGLHQHAALLQHGLREVGDVDVVLHHDNAVRLIHHL